MNRILTAAALMMLFATAAHALPTKMGLEQYYRFNNFDESPHLKRATRQFEENQRFSEDSQHLGNWPHQSSWGGPPGGPSAEGGDGDAVVFWDYDAIDDSRSSISKQNNLIPNAEPPPTTTRTTTVAAVPGSETGRTPCEAGCQTTPEYNPVCGDDSVTYFSLSRLKCAQKCGKRVQLLFLGVCRRRG